MNKLRPNVIILTVFTFLLSCGLLGAIILGFKEGWPLEGMMALAITFGSSLTGMISLSGQIAQDPPPPQVPESTVEKILDYLKLIRLNTKVD